MIFYSKSLLQLLLLKSKNLKSVLNTFRKGQNFSKKYLILSIPNSYNKMLKKETTNIL